MDVKKRILSGVKPTGRPHVGNYLGAMRQFVLLQEEYETFVMIADNHALTTVHDGAMLREHTLGVLLDYLAIGIDPARATVFKQSDVLEHTELAWIFNCITTMPYLMRAHAFKDAEAKNKDINVGTFDYPMLMAADILLYDPDLVPVGKDQKQHVEFARDTAEKFNQIFGDTFKLPEAHIPVDVATVPGTDGQKMSKSYHNTIPLFGSDDEIRKAAMSIVTDSKGVEEPKDTETCNVFALHKHFSHAELGEIERRYREGGIGYKESKERLADNIIRVVAPMRELRASYEADLPAVQKILKEGGERARDSAVRKMTVVRERIGTDLSLT